MRYVLMILLVALACPVSARAETHEVKMLNRGASGPMGYEPDFVQAKPGDTIKFIAATSGHNAATIDGMVPEGHPGFKGKINEEIEVLLDQDGFYGIKCSPHIGMGMVMVIRVGESGLPESFAAGDIPPRARRRFEEILSRNGFGE